MGNRTTTPQMTKTETVVAIDQNTLMVAPLGHAALPLLSTMRTITLVHRAREMLFFGETRL
jgi:hypothetical protein